jgi:hypothetical protein
MANHIPITEEEEKTLTHWSRWGSDGYPVNKVGRGWHVDHFPTVFKTKKAAVAQWETYIDMLIERKGIDAYNNEMARRG